MSIQVDIKITPEDVNNPQAIRDAIILQSDQNLPEHFFYKIIRRNIDARNRKVWYVLRIVIDEKEIYPLKTNYTNQLNSVHHSKEVHIIGAGPCGYFAALQCIQRGLKPIIIERGKDVRERRRDLRAITQDHFVNPNSNYCFGEGGAGTYSDGKLYTRSNKRGNIDQVLQILCEHGASEDILIDVHPHIGSNKLPDIVSNIRKTIENFGGEVHFNQCVEDLVINNNKVHSIKTNSSIFDCTSIILCTGHSARDIYELLWKKNIFIESKAFALGVRIEHPQQLIDEIQYKQSQRHPNLPAASYSIACQAKDKGVFSFCMCPGGLIVPAATAPGEIVVNGMSLSRRDSAFANSGLVTAVDAIDFEPYEKFKELKGMQFQKEVEQKVFNSGNGSQLGPSQRLTDFLKNKTSTTLPPSSYIPGIFSANLSELLPQQIIERLKLGFQQFAQKMPEYLSNEAILVATESRTSSPVRIPRDLTTCEHPQISGLFPAGEGAGYAGGILSAAMDGIRVANAISMNN